MESWLNYFKTMEEVVKKVEETQRDNIMKAARILADTTKNNGIIYGFGTGHSHLVVDDDGSFCPIAGTKLISNLYFAAIADISFRRI